MELNQVRNLVLLRSGEKKILKNCIATTSLAISKLEKLTKTGHLQHFHSGISSRFRAYLRPAALVLLAVGIAVGCREVFVHRYSRDAQTSKQHRDE